MLLWGLIFYFFPAKKGQNQKKGSKPTYNYVSLVYFRKKKVFLKHSWWKKVKKHLPIFALFWQQRCETQAGAPRFWKNNWEKIFFFIFVTYKHALFKTERIFKIAYFSAEKMNFEDCPFSKKVKLLEWFQRK